jgi:hypothetical protein
VTCMEINFPTCMEINFVTCMEINFDKSFWREMIYPWNCTTTEGLTLSPSGSGSRSSEIAGAALGNGECLRACHIHKGDEVHTCFHELIHVVPSSCLRV